ncbi:MAG: glycosyltransferase family 2 protein [bacterium]|nr:glycosyltransferase family 2 protein [bacterium]
MLVTVVIPAYNEEKTVGSVIRAVRASTLVAEVIVVNDGSADGTARVARRAGGQVIDLAENSGKGAAIQAGVEAGRGDVFLFLDADLIGLRPEHIKCLLEPVLRGKSDMTVGVFGGGRAATDLAQAIAPGLSGQRAVRRSLAVKAAGLDMAGYGAEVALNRAAKAMRARTTRVLLPDLTHVMKEEKMGFARGFMARLKMYWEIVKAAQR